MGDFTKEIEELADGLGEIMKRLKSEAIHPAKVLTVDVTALTCDVEDANGNVFFDVKLRATIDNTDDGKYYLPKIGSWVLIANIAHQPNAWCVVMWTEIDKFRWEVRPVILKVDATGFVLEKSSDTLAAMMTELMTQLGNLTTQLQALTVTCAAPGSPSSPPINLSAFTSIGTALGAVKTRFENILKTS